jgi:tetratricopeptide (TPR) repeat protein
LKENSTYFQEAQSLEAKGQLSIAEGKYLLALESSPRSIKVLLALYKICFKQKKWADSLQYLERLTSIYPTEETFYRMGDCYLRLMQPRNAIFHLKKSLDLNPTYINSLLLLAKIYEFGGNLYKKEIYLRLTLEADPKHKEALWDLALLYSETSRYKESFLLLERFLQYFPEEASRGEVFQTDLLLKMGKNASARDLLAESMEADSRIQAIVEKLNQDKEASSRIKEAITEKKAQFQSRKKNHTLSSAFSIELSLLYLMQGNFSSAAKYLVYSKLLKEEKMISSKIENLPETGLIENIYPTD